MSAPVSAIGNGMQLGVETTEGTAVAANKKFQSLSFNLGPRIETDEHLPQGYYFPTGVTPNLDWSEGDIEGRGNYNELTYLFASLLAYAAPVQQAATTAYLWTMTPPVDAAASAHKTYTVEQGFSGSGNARKVAGVYVNAAELTISRKGGIEVGGAVVGRQFLKGQTLTGSPTLIPFVPILPTQVDLYQDTTWAGLGTTKLVDDIAVKVAFGDRFAPWWTLNTANASFASKVNTRPKSDVTLRMAANATGYAYLDALRAGTTIFVRAEAVGAIIASTYPYKLTLDMCLAYSGSSDEEEDDGALVIEAPMTMVADATSGKAFEVRLINTLTAL